MAPALLPGDRLVIARLGGLAIGHVVALPDPRDGSRLLLKRVGDVGGDTIEVFGDNPSSSTDSRHFGRVPAASVRGRVVYRYSPPERAGWFPAQGGRG